MLVCNVSLRPARAAIAVAVVEAAAATDALGTGNIVFATLVDDPANVRDIVNAYLGEIMIEAASAADAVTAGSAYVAAIDETVTATAAQDATVGIPFVARSAMLPDVFVNSDASREACVDGVMVNL